MTHTCPRCSAVIDANSRFCTNCGAVLGAQGPSQQASSQPQVPPWTTANAGAGSYQQQSWGGQRASPVESLGFASQNAALGNNALLRKVLTAIVASMLATLVLLVLLGLLATFIPGLRWVFLLVIVLVIFIPWIIYVNIRRYIRRTVGRIWWFL